MCVLAHPDDESLGTGGILAKYSREGVETFVVTATRGERGRFDDKGTSPGPAVVGQAREAELRAAARELAYAKSACSTTRRRARPVDVAEATEDCGSIRRRGRRSSSLSIPSAVRHPDHVAISQLTAAAIVRAADVHRVSKFYYSSTANGNGGRIKRVRHSANVDGHSRAAIRGRLVHYHQGDARDVWQHVWRAVQCHKTQMTSTERCEPD